jgi:hypothetical protein
VAKKRLTPIPFEAQQAQSEWLLDRFDRGLNSYEEYYNQRENVEERVDNIWLTEPPRRQPRVQLPPVFQFAYAEEDDWLRSIREGSVSPIESNPYHIIRVDTRYLPDNYAYVFRTTYKDIVFQIFYPSEWITQGNLDVVHRRLVHEFTQKFREHDNEQAQRSRL